MFAITTIRPFTYLYKAFGSRRTKKVHPWGSLPSWINDPQLSEQLLKDTGLAPEELFSVPAYNEQKPFFMQQNFW